MSMVESFFKSCSFPLLKMTSLYYIQGLPTSSENSSSNNFHKYFQTKSISRDEERYKKKRGTHEAKTFSCTESHLRIRACCFLISRFFEFTRFPRKWKFLFSSNVEALKFKKKGPFTLLTRKIFIFFLLRDWHREWRYQYRGVKLRPYMKIPVIKIFLNSVQNK